MRKWRCLRVSRAHMLGFTSSGHASKLYWHLLMTFTRLGASRCMNNATHVHVRERERTHAPECKSCPSVYSRPPPPSLCKKEGEKKTVGRCIIFALWHSVQIFIHLVNYSRPFSSNSCQSKVSLKYQSSLANFIFYSNICCNSLLPWLQMR